MSHLISTGTCYVGRLRDSGAHTLHRATAHRSKKTKRHTLCCALLLPAVFSYFHIQLFCLFCEDCFGGLMAWKKAGKALFKSRSRIMAI
jgi:hypothetical protein